MNTIALDTGRYLSIKIAQNVGTNRDGYGYHSLDGGRAVCAWVADAPDAARLDTASTIERAVQDFLFASSGVEQAIAAVASDAEARIILADLVTTVSNSLQTAAAHQGAPMYAAAAFVLVTQQGIHLMAIGDCAALVLLSEPDAIYRLSGTTRLDSVMRLDLLSALRRHPEPYQEGEYLGGQKRLVHPSEVIALPLRGVPRVVLMSDGPERQGTVPEIVTMVRDEPHLQEAAQKTFTEFFMREPPIDDVTLLAFEARLMRPGDPGKMVTTAVARVLAVTLTLALLLLAVGAFAGTMSHIHPSLVIHVIETTTAEFVSCSNDFLFLPSALPQKFASLASALRD